MTNKVKPDTPDDDICGIVMPIAGTEPPYTTDHWSNVRVVIERAIAMSGLRAQPVWEQSTTDVIHSKIIGNLYQNAVVVCDVSALRPNVMLELGMRLSTRMPTVIISDMQVPPPFDTSLIEHLPYPVGLEYLPTDAFMEKLAERIKVVRQAAKEKTYRSFVEQFTFETVSPNQVEVTADQYIMEQLEKLMAAVSRLDNSSRRAAPAPELEKMLYWPQVRSSEPAADITYTFSLSAYGPVEHREALRNALLDAGFSPKRRWSKSSQAEFLITIAPGRYDLLQKIVERFAGSLEIVIAGSDSSP